VEAPRAQVGGEEDSPVDIPKIFVVFDSGFLAEVAVQGHGGDSLGVEEVLKFVQAGDRIAKDHGFEVGVVAQFLKQGLVLVIGLAVQELVLDVMQIEVRIFVVYFNHPRDLLLEVLPQGNWVGGA
jgi:hypothetical protein